MEREEIIKQNSMEYWYNKVKDLHIPQPKTYTLKLTKQQIEDFWENTISDSLLQKAYQIVEKMDYPIFFRTDQSSYKHEWKKASLITKKDEVKKCIFRTVKYNMSCGILGLPFQSLVFRKYIPLESRFTAFFGDLPIAKERRYFIKNGEVLCHHPYWVKNSIRNPSIEKWEEELEELNQESEEEINILTKYALSIADIFDEYWAIDFAYSKEGKWYLLDMSRGESSFHKIDCQYCPEEIREYYQRRNERKKQMEKSLDID